MIKHIIMLKSTHKEKRTVKRKTGKIFQQTFDVGKDEKKVPYGKWDSKSKDSAQKDLAIREEAKKRGYYVAPAWFELWINPNKDGQLQVTGKVWITKNGVKEKKKQYIYSAEHNKNKAAEKFSRVKEFGEKYEKLMGKIEKDFPKKEEAQVLYLISRTGFRIGSEEDLGAKVQAYGASTLLSEHVRVEGDKIYFSFTGKSGIKVGAEKERVIVDAALAKLFKGKKGKLFKVDGNDVRKYLNSIDGNFKIKDFRTFIGTREAMVKIKEIAKPKNPKQLKKAIKAVCKHVASALGNTPAIAKSAYIDPTVWSLLMEDKKKK